MDADGLRVDLVPPQARLVYVTPSHQAPTGCVLSASRRRELLDLASERDMVVIEDDYDTEFRYVDRPLEPLQRMDTEGRVVYVGSFSKTLSPSLRLGFAVASDELVRRFVAARADVDLHPPHLTQAGLAELMASGRFEAHVRRCRRAYRARRDHLVERLDELSAAGLVVTDGTCHAGLHVRVELPGHIDPDAVVAELASIGVVVETDAACWFGAPATALVVGFGLADTHQLESGLDEFERVLRRLDVHGSDE